MHLGEASLPVELLWRLWMPVGADRTSATVEQCVRHLARLQVKVLSHGSVKVVR